MLSTFFRGRTLLVYLDLLVGQFVNNEIVISAYEIVLHFCEVGWGSVYRSIPSASLFNNTYNP